jgi:hypothetical protein
VYFIKSNRRQGAEHRGGSYSTLTYSICQTYEAGPTDLQFLQGVSQGGPSLMCDYHSHAVRITGSLVAVQVGQGMPLDYHPTQGTPEQRASDPGRLQRT